MLRAVPSTIRIAASTSAALRSCILVSAISFTLSRLTVATLLTFGSPEALSIPAAFLSNTAAGGVFVINVNERSSNTVISTGIIMPAWSCVCALNSLQNPIMLIPACPSAGPTGGAGFALPAGICNLTILITFLATRHTSSLVRDVVNGFLFRVPSHSIMYTIFSKCVHQSYIVYLEHICPTLYLAEKFHLV